MTQEITHTYVTNMFKQSHKIVISKLTAAIYTVTLSKVVYFVTIFYCLLRYLLVDRKSIDTHAYLNTFSE